MEPVLQSLRGSASIVTLNRPKALNALTLPMVQLLRPLALSGSPTCLVLRGAGGRAFCAGGDVRTIYDQRPTPSLQQQFFREEYATDFALARHGNTVLPHVALWDGVVMGGGVGVSLHAPFRVATERTLFAMPETAIGLFPDVGSSYALPRLPLGQWWGLYLGLTGARLAGADAVHGGLATHFVPEARLEALVEALAALPPAPARQPYAARAQAVAGALAAHALPPSQLPPFSITPPAAAALQQAFTLPATATAAAAASPLAAIHARLAQLAGAQPVAAQALAALQAASPTACAIALEAQRRGASPGTTLGSALAMELRAMTRLLAGGEGGRSDFYEGVRALLVDKGKGPPPAWGAVAEGGLAPQQLAGYFEGGGEVEGEAQLRAGGSHLQ